MESSGAMDLVCDNLDVITLTCPESQDCSLDSLNDPQHSEKFAFPSLQSLYSGHSMEELFDSNNTPSPEFLRSIRSFIGDLVYRHFGNS